MMDKVYLEISNQYTFNDTNIEVSFGGYFVDIYRKDWSQPVSRWTKKQGENVNKFMALTDKERKKYIRSIK